MSEKTFRHKWVVDDSQYKGKMAGIQKQTTALASSMQSLGGVIAGAFSIAAVVSFSKESMRAYSEQIKAEAKLRQSLKGRISEGDRLIQQANDLQSVTMFSDEDIINAQALLSTTFKTEDQIRTLIPLIADFATVYGIDLDSAVKMVNKSFINSKGLIGKTGLAAEGAANSFERYASIVQLLTDKFAGQAEAAIPDELKALRESQVAVEELKEAWGEMVTTGGGGGLLGLIADGFKDITDNIRQTTRELKELKQGWHNVFGGGGGAAASTGTTVDMGNLSELARQAAGKVEMGPSRQGFEDFTAFVEKSEKALKDKAEADKEAAKAAKEHAAAVKELSERIAELLQVQLQSNKYYPSKIEPKSFVDPNVLSPVFGSTDVQGFSSWLSNTDNLVAFQDEMYNTGLAYTSTIEDMMALNAQFQQTTEQAFAAIGSALGNAIGEFIKGEAKFSDVAGNLIASILQIIAGYLSESIAASFAGGASAGGPLAPITGASAAALALSLFSSMVPALMAEGGTVPGGYPGDTYPALLTSGEMVVPPHKLGAIGGGNIQLSGQFEIQGDKLIYLVNQMNSKYARYK